ncbi:MAG: hypothetical protein J7500_07945 [Sphingomonas sp.]|uniref:hypothetical protein n=1 Tax=Sphingomonas sp. TaxID=28214 RepID=UPI001B0C8A82|nr:hypothetical protein [Sphingomonas sp.]MBO9622629.1 hypothetical protein [Sphingomonas sp.]
MPKPRMTAAALVLALAACAPEQPADNGSGTARLVAEGNADEIVVPQGNGTDGNAAAPTPTNHGVNLAPDGLALVLQGGATRHIGFGLTREEAVRLVSAGLGEPESQDFNQECPGGALEEVEFDGGLGLSFSEGRFVGWDLNSRDDGRFTTAAGIGLGSTRKQLESAMAIEVEESSLGHEFHSGMLSGLLDSLAPTGKITALWAGNTCIFR